MMPNIKLSKALKNAAEEEQRAAEEQEFRRKLPELMLHLMARASKFVMCKVEPHGADGWQVTFDFNKETWPVFHDASMEQFYADGHIGSEVITSDAEQWEFDILVGATDAVEASRKAAAERLKLARETYDSLSEEQRKALGLTRRP